jgi:hypothetical protein
MQLAIENLLDGEGAVDGWVLGGESDWRERGVAEKGDVPVVLVWRGIGEVEMKMKVGLVSGLAEVSVDEAAEDEFLDGWGDEGWED